MSDTIAEAQQKEIKVGDFVAPDYESMSDTVKRFYEGLKRGVVIRVNLAEVMVRWNGNQVRGCSIRSLKKFEVNTLKEDV